MQDLLVAASCGQQKLISNGSTDTKRSNDHPTSDWPRLECTPSTRCHADDSAIDHSEMNERVQPHETFYGCSSVKSGTAASPATGADS